MTEVLEIGILWREFSPLALPSLFVYFFESVVKLVARIVRRTFGLLFLRSLGCVDFCWKIWLQGRGCRLIVGLAVDDNANEHQHDQCDYPFHEGTKIRKGKKLR